MRDKKIIQTSIIGILANVFLAGFKAAVGLLTHSIAITLDAVNNLSDALSSVITIVGTKLANKPADKEHPLGHGRIEYLSAMVIGVIILYAGVTSLIESVKAIMSPTSPAYTMPSLVIVGVAVLVKIVLGRYVKKVGEDVNSGSLIASGEDATLDAVISASTLLAAFIYIGTKVSLEAYLGAIISLIIIKAGIDTLKETISSIEGERVDSALSKQIKDTAMKFDGVSGVYDLTLHNYGPDRYYGSMHIEVPSDYTADKIDLLIRNITDSVYEETGVIMTGVGIYSKNESNDLANELRSKIKKAVMAHDNVIQVHGFYLNEEEKTLTFDVVISFDEKDRVGLYNRIVEEIKEMVPEYNVRVTLDTDVSD